MIFWLYAPSLGWARFRLPVSEVLTWAQGGRGRKVVKRTSKIAAGVVAALLLVLGLSAIPGLAQTKMNLTSGFANANGDFSIAVKIPNDTDPGSYDLRATCNAPATGTASSAGTYPPTSATATVSKTSVAEGETIVMGGGGCVPNALVTIDLIKTSALGLLSLAGQAEAQTTTRTLTAKITVTGPAPAAAATTAAGAATTAPKGKLSATGFPALPFLLAGLAALAIGSGFIVAARRRDQKGQPTAGS